MKIIALEGIDGSGKSTIINKLKERYKKSEKVVFIKSPLSPFNEMMPKFWNSPAYVRMMFFALSNYHLSEQIIDDKVYVLDRYVYSTYVTHIDKVDKAVALQSISEMEITYPVKTYLIKAPLEEIQRRLVERNNDIDNALNIKQLYSLYYDNICNQFGEIEVVRNVNEQNLSDNIKLISEGIDEFLFQED